MPASGSHRGLLTLRGGRSRERNCGTLCLLKCTLLVALLTAPRTARAHRLDASAWLDAGGVRIVARYADGSPVAHGTILVFVRGEDDIDRDKFRGPPLFQDKLDGDGKFVFMPTAQRDFLCVIDDGVGHRGELEIRGEDLLALFDPSFGAPDPAATSVPRRIAATDRPLVSEDLPLWVRIGAGIVAIALVTAGLSWLLRLFRNHAP